MENVGNPLQQLFILALLQKQNEIKEVKSILVNALYLSYISEVTKFEIQRERLTFIDPTGLRKTKEERRAERLEKKLMRKAKRQERQSNRGNRGGKGNGNGKGKNNGNGNGNDKGKEGKSTSSGFGILINGKYYPQSVLDPMKLAMHHAMGRFRELTADDVKNRKKQNTSTTTTSSTSNSSPSYDYGDDDDDEEHHHGHTPGGNNSGGGGNHGTTNHKPTYTKKTNPLKGHNYSNSLSGKIKVRQVMINDVNLPNPIQVNPIIEKRERIQEKYQDQIDKHNRTKARLDIAHDIFATIRDFGFMVGAVCLGTAAIIYLWPALVAGGTIAVADGDPTNELNSIVRVVKGAKYLNPGVGGAARGSIYNNAWIRHNVYNQIRNKLGKQGIEKFINAMNKGIVGAKGQIGIKMLAGKGIEKAGVFYKYELKILGKLGDYRVYGNMADTGNIIFNFFGRH